MAFHGALFCLAGLGGVLFILSRLNAGPSEPVGYIDGPIKVATIAAVIWGIAGFVVGDILAWHWRC